MDRPKILHIITGLDTGGAEILLYSILRRHDPSLYQHEVISLTDIGLIGQKIRALSIPVYSLQMPRGKIRVRKIISLIKLIKHLSPDLIQTWLYHSNLIAGVAGKFAKQQSAIVWSLHSGELSKGVKSSTRYVMNICSVLSKYLPTRIISTSEAASQAHIKSGYDATKMITIQNGVDCELFKPDPAARISLRRELGLEEDAFLIGLVARFDPQKDHANFIQAAQILHERYKNVHFVLCGKDITDDNLELITWIKASNISSVCHLLGLRTDMPNLQAALDIACLSSYGETSALVVAESMACEVPCVVTDVGDLKLIIGETGKCVPPRNAGALAEALSDLIVLPSLTRQVLGQNARQRIINLFEIRHTTAQYERVWSNVLQEYNKG